MKKSLQEMLSKSEERRKKPRALPNLQAVPRGQMRSPSPLSPGHPVIGTGEVVNRPSPKPLLSPTGTKATPALSSTAGERKKSEMLPSRSAEFLKPEVAVSPVTSEILYHARDEVQNSSSGEIEPHNLMPLSLEIEYKENLGTQRSEESAGLESTDEASTGSEIVSQTSLPVGYVTMPFQPLETASTEEAATASLPDLDSQYETER